MKQTIKAAIYIRVSTLDQANNGYSLEAQETALRKWCAQHNHQVYDLYADRGRSGKDIDRRPDMRRLLEDAKNGCFEVVVFWALSRFTRSVQNLYSTMEKFQKWGISMVSYTESFDTSTPMGRAMIGIVGIFAQLERELTGERICAAALVRAEQGKRTCSRVLGYDVDGKSSLKINEKEAEYVKFLFEKYLERKNLTEVATLAKEAGYKGKRGAPPEASHLLKILINPVYVGYNVFHGEIYKGAHPPIIAPQQFNKVQRMLTKQGKVTGRNRTTHKIHIVPEE